MITIEKTLPIKILGGWDSVDMLFNNYYDVEFTEDFGVFKSGDKFTSISVNYDKGVVEAYDENGEPVKQQKYIAKAI